MWLFCLTFSIDFSVEYAQKAVDNGGTMIAIRGKDGVVTAADKLITSKLYVEVFFFFFFAPLRFFLNFPTNSNHSASSLSDVRQ